MKKLKFDLQLFATINNSNSNWAIEGTTDNDSIRNYRGSYGDLTNVSVFAGKQGVKIGIRDCPGFPIDAFEKGSWRIGHKPGFAKPCSFAQIKTGECPAQGTVGKIDAGDEFVSLFFEEEKVDGDIVVLFGYAVIEEGIAILNRTQIAIREKTKGFQIIQKLFSWHIEKEADIHVFVVAKQSAISDNPKQCSEGEKEGNAKSL